MLTVQFSIHRQRENNLENKIKQTVDPNFKLDGFEKYNMCYAYNYVFTILTGPTNINDNRSKTVTVAITWTFSQSFISAAKHAKEVN